MTEYAPQSWVEATCADLQRQIDALADQLDALPRCRCHHDPPTGPGSGTTPPPDRTLPAESAGDNDG